MSFKTWKFYLLLSLPVLLVLVGFPSPVSALNFNAYWYYRQLGGDNIPTRNEFQQRYTLGVGQGLSIQPTRAISAAANLSYSRSERDQGQGKGLTGVDVLTPAAQLSLVNDIFLAQLSGSNERIYRDRGGDSSTRSWDSTFGTRWNVPLWPSIRFNYGERAESANDFLKTKTSGVSVDWDLLVAELNYQYRKSQSELPDTDNLAEQDSHFARFRTSGGFWHNRVGFSLTQQFQMATQNSTLLLGQALALVNDPTTGPDPEDAVVENNGLLSDGDKSAAALEVPADQQMLLGFNFSFPQQIGALTLFLDPLTPLTGTQAAALRWDLYVRNAFDTGWDRVATDIPAAYAAEETRFDLTIDLFAQEFMVVAVNNTGIPLVFTEIEAGRPLSEKVRTRSTDYLTNFNLRFLLTKNLSLSTSLMSELLQNESGDISSEYDHQTFSTRLSWHPVPYLRPSLGYSQTRENRTRQPDKINHSYGLTVVTLPLPTMNVSLSATRNEGYIGQKKIISSDRYSLYTKAQIYPDLAAGLSFNQRYTDNLDKDGKFVRTSTFSTRLDLSAQLTRALTVDLSTDYNRTSSETRSSKGGTAKLEALYRPSELLALRGSYNTVLLGPKSSDQMLLGMNLRLLRTDKTRLDLSSNYQQSSTSSAIFVVRGSWDINPKLSLQTKTNYAIAQEGSLYDFFVSMALRL